MSKRTQSVSYKCAKRRAKRIAAGLPVRPLKVAARIGSCDQCSKLKTPCLFGEHDECPYRQKGPTGAEKWATVFRERIE